MAIQARLGVQSQMDKQARRVVRDYLPSIISILQPTALPDCGTVDASNRGLPFGGNQALSLRQTIVHYESPVNLVGDPLATTHRWNRHRFAGN